MITISRNDLLVPFSQFEKRHNIKKIRQDLPYRFLGASPSKYYRTVDMNVKQAEGIAATLFHKLYRKEL